MAELRINPTKLEALIRRYRPEAKSQDGAGGTQELIMLCPFHSDSRPSFSLNLHRGVGYCFSCPKDKGHTLDDTIAALEGKSTRQAHSMLRGEGVYENPKKEVKLSKEERASSCGIKLEQIGMWHETLMQNASMTGEIISATGWTSETLRRFNIGYDGSYFTIPNIVNGVVVNVKYYKPSAKTNKYKGVEGANENRVWPLEHLSKEGTVWLMEGEKDCILANQCGMNAVTFTGGAGSVPMEYIGRFKGRDVNIVYDIDPPGKEGALAASTQLLRVANSVKIVEIPSDGLPPNGDFTNFIHNAGHQIIELFQIAQMTEAERPRDSKTKVVIGDEVINTYLEDITPKKLFHKRVRMRVRIVSMSKCATYLVPKEVICRCSKSLGDQCYSCKAYHNVDPLTLHMKPEYPEIMQLIDSDDNKQKIAIKNLLEIYHKCPKVEYEFKEHQAFYPIVIIPALEKDKATHSYTMTTAWALDVPSETNEDYLAEAVVLGNPNDQQMTIICYKLDKDLQSVDAFELTEELREALKVFQVCPPQPTTSVIN
jgi:hypothetical protein